MKLAHTSHGTFYLYFANKEDLFRALAAEVADAMHDLAESLGPLEPGPGRAGRAARLDRASFADLYEHHGPVIRAWTEAEIGGSEFGRLGTDVLTRVHPRPRTAASPTVAPADLDPAIASLALVAMLERCNYYVLSGQVDVERDAMVDTLAARDPRRAVRRLQRSSASTTTGRRRARVPAGRRARRPGPSTRPRP